MYNKLFIKSINERLIVKLTFKSVKNEVLTRNCIPFDFGPSRKFKD